MEAKVSAKDVARYVGVSEATVSNVINNINKVSDETRKRVLKAIEVLHYQPDYTARSLARRKSNLLGIMFPITQDEDDKSLLLKDNPFYAEFLSGIEYEAERLDYDVLITGIRPEQSLKDWVSKRNIDGVIFLGITPEIFLKELESFQVPVVLLDTPEIDGWYHTIGNDEKLAGAMACQHLTNLGHTRIALASGPIDTSPVNYNRYIGYCEALEKSRIPLDMSLVFEDSVSFDGGCRIGERIFKSVKNITAVFCVADIMAFGVIKALREHGIKVPEDISIIGFDNLKICDYLVPGLTTIDQGIFQKGVLAANVLISDIEGKLNESKRTVIPVKMVERESAAPCKS